MKSQKTLKLQPKDAIKLLEISANLTSDLMQMKAKNGHGELTEDELKKMFSVCVDMLHEKFRTLPTCEQEFQALNEKFSSISEMHQIFSDKITTVEKRLATLPQHRASRRAGGL
ncbi:MAG: hypothetical protein KAI17_04675 [Thiotrichaceae bacterium]|nr:hypothetical protein [Thiotrichaceae bacterium]